jgi:hypothetical protein
MFQDKGMLQSDKVYAAFEQSVHKMHGFVAEWLPIIRKSIKTCQEISEKLSNFPSVLQTRVF